MTRLYSPEDDGALFRFGVPRGGTSFVALALK
jgi:hypothetical protein